MKFLISRCYNQRLLRSLALVFSTPRRGARCGFSTGLRAQRPEMVSDRLDYVWWTKTALIERLRALDADIKSLEDDRRLADTTTTTTTTTAGDGGGASSSQPPPLPQKKKLDRRIDPSKYSTRLVAFKLAYLGKNYGGFEFSTHASAPSIEEELWNAFVKSCLIFPENPEVVNWESWEYSKCGRTDRGVSAFGQVIAVRVRSNRPLESKEKSPAETEEGGEDGKEAQAEQDTSPEQARKPDREFNDHLDELPYCRMLNKLLPPDIRMLAWCPTTPEDFSARYDCRERQYRYFFTQPAFSPLPHDIENPEATKVTKIKSGWLDIAAMREAAKKFEGVHDFRNFCRTDHAKPNIKFERRVYESDIVEVPDAETGLPFLDRDQFRPQGLVDKSQKVPSVYYFHVRGTAFLWHQIRCMVAVLFMVGQGLEDPSIVDRLLDIEAEPRRPNYALADEVPLVLWDCLFPRGEAPPERHDAIKWAYLGEDNPLDQHGVGGLLSHAWEHWRDRKMDELLSAQLLNVVATQPDISLRRDPKAPAYARPSTRMCEGANRERAIGRYQSLLKRQRLPSPEESFDKEARRRGYASAVEWREAQARRKAEHEAKTAEAGADWPTLEARAESLALDEGEE